jgi:F-type H+-transporting ATPase subunit delta
MKTDDRSSAHQYARALLQLTEVQGDEEDVFKNLETVSQVFQDEPRYNMLFRHPAIPAPEKLQLIAQFSGSLDKLSANLLLLLCERRKLQLLPLIVAEFHKLLRAKHNIVSGTLVSAEPMSEEAVSAIKRRLVKQMRKHVELIVETDKSLIGGYLLKMGDQIIDGSLKGRLASVEKALLSV